MIHDIAIWKLVLAGFVLVCFSFLVSFILACVLAASGKAADIEEERVKRIRKYMGRIDEAHDRAQYRGGAQ